MLYALDETSKLCSAVAAAKRRYAGDFFCPACRERVLLKNGQYKAAHFAHHHKCRLDGFSEGETAVHLNGKKAFIDWLSLVPACRLYPEQWLPQLQQRPDILIRTEEGQQYALEYQCSPISFERMRERTAGYQKEGIAAVWIGGPQYRSKLQLKAKTVQLMHYDNRWGFWYPVYDADTGCLYLFHHCRYNGLGNYTYEQALFQLQELKWTDFLGLPQTLAKKGSQPKKGIEEREVFYLKEEEYGRILQHRDPAHRSFLERMYLNQDTYVSLPGVLWQYPHKNILFSTPGYIWKYHCWLWIRKRGQGAILTEGELLRLFRKLKREKIITVSEGVYFRESHYFQQFLHFLYQLEEAGMLQPVGPGQWLIIREIEER